MTNYEYLARKILKYYLPEHRPIYNYRPNWLCYINGYNLEIDIFYDDLNIAIEVNGVMHQLKKQKKRDHFKYSQCKKRGIYYIALTGRPRSWIKRLNNFFDFSPKIPHGVIKSLDDYRPKKNTKMHRYYKYQKKTEKAFDIQEEETRQNRIRYMAKYG